MSLGAGEPTVLILILTVPLPCCVTLKMPLPFSELCFYILVTFLSFSFSFPAWYKFHREKVVKIREV